MLRPAKHDSQFEIQFFEAVHQRCPGYTEVVGLLGGLYTKAGRIVDGLRMDRKLVRLEPANPTAHYNLACSLALCKKRPKKKPRLSIPAAPTPWPKCTHIGSA